MARIALAEPDPALRRVLSRRLELEGYTVRSLESPDDVVEQLRQTGADVLVMATDQESDVLPRLRDQSPVLTVVMLPVGTDPAYSFEVLDAGADEYVIKPFSPRELVSRLRALLRRSTAVVLEQPRRFDFGALVIDTGFREVSLRGRKIPLPAKEFDLLALMASSPREVFTREQLMTKIWGVDVVGTSATVTEHIRRLRTRIEDDPRHPRWIETVWSVGYRFNPAADADQP